MDSLFNILFQHNDEIIVRIESQQLRTPLENLNCVRIEPMANTFQNDIFANRLVLLNGFHDNGIGKENTSQTVIN